MTKRQSTHICQADDLRAAPAPGIWRSRPRRDRNPTMSPDALSSSQPTELLIPNFVARREDFVFRCGRKVVSFRGSFPRNPVGGRTFELDRRDSLFGLRAQARAASRAGTGWTFDLVPQGTNQSRRW